MVWQYVYLILLYASAAISIAIAVYAWRNRSRSGLLYFTFMMLAVAEYTLTAGLMSSAATPAGAVSWVHFHYFGLTSMVAFFIAFVIQFTGYGKWLNKYTLFIIFAIPVITQIIIETNWLHHWFIQEIAFEQDGILMGLATIRYGGFFWFHTLYNYGLVLLAMVLMIVMSVRSFKLYRMQSLTLFIAVLAPVLGSINDSKVFMAGFPYPIVPISFSLMGVLIAWNVFRNQMLNIIPVARDVLIESMSDSLIVLDASANVIDINPTALQLLEREASQIIGKPIGQIFSR
ncbi:MAG: PAS domain-containing protein [Anaerolineaceae bacterium]|nr:PAS domain-containing protein [Anaerolineaceae bacterium]